LKKLGKIMSARYVSHVPHVPRAMRQGAALFRWFCWLVLPAVAAQAAAASWLTVYDGNAERVAVDVARIESGANGVAAWSRIDLGRLVGDAMGGYDNIQALNAYDCAARRFTTLRRAYFRGNALVRELPPPRRQRNVVYSGSLEEKVFNVACRRSDAQPALMHAVAREDADVHVLPVADQATPDKPRLIALPPIDKAAADRAAAAVAEKKAAEKSSSAAPGSAKEQTKEQAKEQAKSKAATSSAAVSGDDAVSPAPTFSRSAVSPAAKTASGNAKYRQSRELYYATSGPRRGTVKNTEKNTRDSSPASASPKPLRTPGNVRPPVDDWAYAGERGPAHWAQLSHDYALCGEGKRQSPIDIRDGIKVDLEPIGFDYKPSHFSILDTGHTVRVNPAENMGLTLTGKRYRLTEFHFHQPAEEVVEGRGYDMAIHLVHRADDGSPLIVTLLLTRGETEQPLIQTLWNNLPLDRGLVVAPADTIDLNALLPQDRRYWTYIGSLTEPPCSEGVTWLVLKQPVVISAAQAAIFSRLYSHNARPVQPGNGRLIKESR
jgi:carbonic anhydrase